MRHLLFIPSFVSAIAGATTFQCPPAFILAAKSRYLNSESSILVGGSRVEERRLEELTRTHDVTDRDLADLVERRPELFEPLSAAGFYLPVTNPFEGRNLDFVETYVGHANPNVRRMAIQSLSEIYTERADRLLARGLRDPDPRIRAVAIQATPERPEEDILPALERIVAAPAGNNEKRKAQDAIRQLGAAKPTSESIRAASENPDPVVRNKISDGLMRVPTSDLAIAMRSPYPDFRNSAAIALSHRQDPEAVRLTLDSYHVEPVDEIRVALFRAARQQANPGAKSVVEHFLGHADTPALSTAARSFPGAREAELAFNPASTVPPLEIRLPLPDSGPESPSEAKRRVERYTVTADAADLVYHVADPEVSRDAKALAESHLEFEKRIPPGYTSNSLLDGAQSLKAVLLSPEYDSREDAKHPRPYILSFAGTHRFSDALHDLNFGKDRANSPVIKETLDLAIKELKAGRDFYVVGHSLGGGLAQLVGAYLQSQLMRDPEYKYLKSRAGTVRVHSFNGFGVQEQLAKDYVGRAPHLDSTQIAVDGDIVSRLGRNSSDYWIIPAPGKSLGARHQLGTVQDLMKQMVDGKIPIPKLDLRLHSQTMIKQDPDPNESPHNAIRRIWGTTIVGKMLSKPALAIYRRVNQARLLPNAQKLMDAQYLFTQARGHRNLSQEGRWLDRELQDMQKQAGKQTEAFNKLMEKHRMRMDALLRELQAPRTVPYGN